MCITSNYVEAYHESNGCAVFKVTLEIACSFMSTTTMRVAISSITATGYQKSRLDACEWKLHRFIESHVSRCVRMERRGLHITPTQHKFICSPHLNRKTRHIAMTHIKPNNNTPCD